MKNAKSLLSIILAVLMVASMIVLPVSAEEPWDEWDGTADDDSWKTPDREGVYHITNAEQLANLAKEINADVTASKNFYQGKTIKLDVNIRLNSEADIANFANWGTSAPAKIWTPIGTYDSKQSVYHSFNGTFDGQGHTISGMYVPGQEHKGNRSALFGIVGELFTIKDLNVTNAYISGAGNGVSIIAGQMANTHSNKDPQIVAQDVTITDSYLKGEGGGTGVILGRTAGLIGQTLVFDNCDISNTSINGTSYVGGIFGFHGSSDLGALEFKNCDLTDNTITGKESSGGIMAGSSSLKANTEATIKFENCHTNQTIQMNDVNGGNNNGGILGYLQSPVKKVSFVDCSVAGEIHTLQNSGIFLGRVGTSAANKGVSIEVINCESTASLYGDFARDGYNANCNGVVVGLFQAKDGTTISNITVDGLTVSGDIDVTAKSGDTVGIIASVGPVIDVLKINNLVSTANISAKKFAAGVFANISAKDITITNTVVKGDVTVSEGLAAGIGGAQNSKGTLYVENTFVTGNVTGGTADKANLGGMFGYLYSTDIDIVRSGVTGTLTSIGSSSRNYGGFIGDIVEIADVTFESCIFTGEMNGSANYMGIFVGDYDPNGGTNAADNGSHSGTITVNNCYADADLEGTHSVGGIIGRSWPHNININVKDSIVLGDRVATAADKTDSVAAIIAAYGKVNTKGGFANIDGLYYDADVALGNFNCDEFDPFAVNKTYTPETLADFEAVLEASSAWGKGTDGLWYPVGLSYPGHDDVWGDWTEYPEEGIRVRNCTIFGCTETQEEEMETAAVCTCRGRSDWSAWKVATLATCDTDGTSFRTCKGCGVVEWATVAAGHKWGEWTTDCADDTDHDGYVYQTRVCYGTCGETEVGTTLVAAAHKAIWTATTAPTATQTGTESLVCIYCHQAIDTRDIPALGSGEVTPIIPVEPSVAPYTDIVGHKYQKDIEFVTAYGLFNGMGNGLFQPETTMTRGMIVTVLARLAKVDVTSYKNNFTDVSSDSYYAPYVGWAEAVEITNGYGDGTFRPSEEITKEQAIAMIARYLTHIGNKDTTSNNKADFTDLNTGSDWAKDVVAEAIRLGIIENDATTFRPTASATRAELANFFANIVEYLTK